ncbi:MAG: hypothetical protein ACI8PT_000789 [Gammaproteobacteria bacterium]|jgi:hypothetical protein
MCTYISRALDIACGVFKDVGARAYIRLHKILYEDATDQVWFFLTILSKKAWYEVAVLTDE